MAERPLECSQCKKAIAVHYTEMANENRAELVMCSECPVLQRKLHGTTPEEVAAPATQQAAGVVCGNCGNSLESVRTGNPLGCSECYEVFRDIISFDLTQSKRIYRGTERSGAQRATFHVGRTPGEVIELSPEIKLIALNEALSETLTKEDYEQAAWLRDQIQRLKEHMDEGDEG